jgi:hypothetical protein
MERIEMKDATILIYDDETKNGTRYVERLKKSKEVGKYFKNVECIDHSVFLKEMKELKERQIALRNGKKRKSQKLKIDGAAILIVDYDLVKAPEYASFLTGEIVSYYVRCFSECRFVIGLNQYGTNNFDLSLKRHPKSYADLNIGSEQLDNPGLWGDKLEGFRPWYWPNIPKYLENIDKKMKDLDENLKTPICEFFGMSEEVIGTMPRTVSEFLGGDPQAISFESFLHESGNALIPKDKEKIEMETRVMKLLTISRISKWLEESVLPGQNILIDAPHLVNRYPSLLKGTHDDLKIWDKTATFEKFDKLGLNHETIEKYRFVKDHWLSRSAWFLNGIINCQDIKEVSDPWTRESTDYVFCEDSSSFYKKNKCKEFLAEIETPYARRFVREFKGVDYVPRVRFAL